MPTTALLIIIICPIIAIGAFILAYRRNKKSTKDKRIKWSIIWVFIWLCFMLLLSLIENLYCKDGSFVSVFVRHLTAPTNIAVLLSTSIFAIIVNIIWGDKWDKKRQDKKNSRNIS
jgi:chromate transport protein ChrA